MELKTILILTAIYIGKNNLCHIPCLLFAIIVAWQHHNESIETGTDPS
jgi:hypothetical protein